MNKLFIPLLVIVLLLAGCGGNPATPATGEPPPPDENDHKNLVIADPGKSLEVTAGNEFIIIIDSNPTTGYHWELIGNLDDTLVRFVSKDYRADEPVMVGSGGTDAWTFKAIAAGEVKIVLGNYPPGEDEPAVQEVTFTVIIK